MICFSPNRFPRRFDEKSSSCDERTSHTPNSIIKKGIIDTQQKASEPTTPSATGQQAGQKQQRYQSVQGAAGGSKVAASKTRQAANKTPGKARSRKGPRWSSQKAVSETLPRDETSAQARKPPLSVKASVVETRKAGGAATLFTVALGRREESSAHTKAPALRC